MIENGLSLINKIKSDKKNDHGDQSPRLAIPITNTSGWLAALFRRNPWKPPPSSHILHPTEEWASRPSSGLLGTGPGSLEVTQGVSGKGGPGSEPF